jgi:protein TonB
MDAVRRWTFKPAVRGGQPVDADVIVPLEFNPGG